MRSLLGTTSYFYEVVVLKLRTAPIGAALSFRILPVIRRYLFTTNGLEVVEVRGGAEVHHLPRGETHFQNNYFAEM